MNDDKTAERVANRKLFRFAAIALSVNYWADAGTKLVESGGSFWAWTHMVLACVAAIWFLSEAWRMSVPRPGENRL